MTGEQFHDVLTLLPADLIAQADEYRCRKPKVIPWQRYFAIAACFAVLLCSAAIYRNFRQKSAVTEMAVVPYSVMQDTNAAAEAPQPEAAKEAPADEAPRLEASKRAPAAGSAAAEDNGISFVCVETPVNVHTTASFVHGAPVTVAVSRAELDDYLSKWERLYLLDSLQDTCAIYDGDWFDTHDLLLIPVDCVTGPCTVTDREISDGICQVTIDIGGEEADAQTNYNILLPLEKGTVSDPGNITIIYKTDTTG